MINLRTQRILRDIFLGGVLAWCFVGALAGQARAGNDGAKTPSPSAASTSRTALQLPINKAKFETWLVGLRKEALSQGIRAGTLDSALANLSPIPRVIELDRRQPEFALTFRDYIKRLVSPERIKNGQLKYNENKSLLKKIQAKYGVQGRFLTAFWGVETDFGRLSGGYFPVIGALATLAYDGRRSAFFRAQLIDALKILDQGNIDLAHMKGSWAGAMGHFQFIPSTFMAYAVDFDGDGKRNIWSDKKDGFASAANFLSHSGWNAHQTWGREVVVPQKFDYDLTGLGVQKTLGQWQKIGVRRPGGGDLPKADMKASLVLPAGHRGPAFLVYQNFRAMMVWNRSVNYALAVGYLADRIVGLGEMYNSGPKDDVALTRTQVLRMQTLLNTLGYDVGAPDGIAGAQTRKAVANFQRQTGAIADGYPSLDVLVALNKADASKTSSGN
ncbi:membrane-bound lytic murein transglycosylase B [Varunaivibrio sulfuroxidans]|uniref:Membrane-bound lytic murein transglycosylase B n=2 Tax=Varunaivibrio sulfuroxidans TaxID=1773489 RepID=A0A4R3JEP7_9PROT|nr:membrane-bound lytic murein transglycosylase B [Varunaivibrio sulfuroxidans]